MIAAGLARDSEVAYGGPVRLHRMSVGAVIQGRHFMYKTNVPSGAARIRRFVILVAVVLLVMPATASADVGAKAASTCSDYSNQADAQRVRRLAADCERDGRQHEEGHPVRGANQLWSLPIACSSPP